VHYAKAPVIAPASHSMADMLALAHQLVQAPQAH
jgi:hypothetical protein